jgi:cytochrome c
MGEANRYLTGAVEPSAVDPRRYRVAPLREPAAMNSFELNKILGAVLATCLALLSLNIAASALFSSEKPAKPGFDIAVKEAAHGQVAAPKEPEQPIEQLMANASAEKGGPNRVGPNLWGIVGDERGHGRGGFNFSAAMKAKGGTWTYDELNKFLANPRGYIPGTAMSFAGISRDQQRADLIAYLRAQADSPQPLPTAKK